MADRAAFLEALSAGEGQQPRAYRVRVIRAGLSLNRTFYPDAVLREAVQKFNGARVFVKSDREHLAEGGKDVRNIIGGLSEARFIAGASQDTGSIEATLTLIIGDDDPIAIRLREAVAQKMTDLFGLSVDVSGPAESRPGGVRVARGFSRVHSVDLIVDPGAGGQVISFREAADEGNPMGRDQIIATIQSANPALLEGVDVASISDADLLALLARAITPAPRTTEADNPSGDAPTDPASMSREQLIAAISAIDPARVPADLSTVTDDDLRAILAAATPAATVAMIEAAVDRHVRLRAQLDACTLPDASKARIRTEMGTIRFTEAAMTARIKQEGEYLAGLGFGRVALSGTGGGYNFVRGESQGDKHVRMLEAFFDPNHKDHSHARSFKECYVAITGDTRVTGQLKHARFTEALTTASWADVLGNSITRKMIADYRAATDLDMWKLLTGTPVPIGDFRTQERTRFGGYGDLPAVAQAGPYVALTSPGDEAATYAVSKRGGLETITLEMIKNDDVGSIQRIPTKLARAAKRTLCKFVLDFIRSNPTIYDTLALFHATHNNLGAAALASGTWAAARLAMMAQTEDGTSEALGIGPSVLWVPPGLEETAANLFRRNTNLDATFIQSLTPTIVPVWYWTDANDWAATANVQDIPFIELGFLDGEEEPALFVQDDPKVGSMFSNDQLTYKIRHIYGAGVLDYRGAYKAVVA